MTAKSISQSDFTVLLAILIPPALCLMEYAALIGSAGFVLIQPFPWLYKVIAVIPLSIGTTTIPFWHKMFFDEGFIGIDAPVRVEWTADRVSFDGAYFRIQVPVENILEYRTTGIRRFEQAFTVSVKIMGPHGKKMTMHLGNQMQRKHDFLAFLDGLRTSATQAEDEE